MFNALKYIHNLEAAGFQRDQAEAQVQLVIDAFNDEVATRSDMAELRSEMVEMKAELKTELKTEIALIRTDMAKLKGELILQLGGITVASVTLATTIIGFMLKHA